MPIKIDKNIEVYFINKVTNKIIFKTNIVSCDFIQKTYGKNE